MLTCLALWDDAYPCLTDDSRERLKQWLLKKHHGSIELWGEAAIACLAPWVVWCRKHDPTSRPDHEIATLAEIVITNNQSKSESALPAPYYCFEDVARFGMRLEKKDDASALEQETFAGSAFTAESLLHLLVRTNQKQKCKALWPDFTRLSHRGCVPDHSWEYATIRIKHGADETKIYPSTYPWANLKADAMAPKTSPIPQELATRPWLLALWWQLVPYRYTAAASRVFVEGVLPGWGLECGR